MGRVENVSLIGLDYVETVNVVDAIEECRFAIGESVRRDRYNGTNRWKAKPNGDTSSSLRLTYGNFYEHIEVVIDTGRFDFYREIHNPSRKREVTSIRLDSRKPSVKGYELVNGQDTKSPMVAVIDRQMSSLP